MPEPTDELREALRDAIAGRLGNGPSAWHTAATLLPVVTAWAEDRARERAAEELGAAARELVDDTGLDLVGAWQLRARADALAAQASTNSPGMPGTEK